jgi:hypothetical protein
LKKNGNQQQEFSHLQEILRDHYPNEILLFDSSRSSKLQQFPVSRYYLTYQSQPIYPCSKSQYVVDYVTKKLYFFNLFWKEQYQNFLFPIDFSKPELYGERLESNAQMRVQVPFKVGLSLKGTKIFCVFGMNQQNQACTSILIFDAIERK